MKWLGWFEPKPMYLGLDLRGGVHFLLQVDMRGALTGRYDALASDMRLTLSQQRIEGSVDRNGNSVVGSFATEDARNRVLSTMRGRQTDLTYTTREDNDHFLSLIHISEPTRPY